MKSISLKKIISAVTIFAVVTSFSFFIFTPKTVDAAALTNVSDQLSSIKASYTTANHTIQFITPTGVTGGQDITLTFAAGFNMNSVDFQDVDVAISSGSSCSSFSDIGVVNGAAVTTSWGYSISGQVITFDTGSGGVTAGRCVQIEIGSNATTGATGNTYIINPTAGTHAIAIGGTITDSGSTSVIIISDDQVVITATVAQTLAFTITDNAIGFGTLSSSASTYATGNAAGTTTETSAHDLTAATNAPSGYSVYISGATLASGANTITAIGTSPTALSAGTEQFGIRATASGGSGTVAAPFAGSSGSYGFGTSPLAGVTFASSATASATTTYSNYYAANISGATEAGAYTTTLTYVATANF